MVTVDCNIFKFLMIDDKNRIAVFFAASSDTYEEILDLVFEIIYYKKYCFKSSFLKIIKLNDFPYFYFDTVLQKIHYFTDIPSKEYVSQWIQKTKQ